MKILQLIQKSQLRGAEIFAAQLAEELLGSGNEVILVSLFESNGTLPFSGKQICLQADSGNRFWDKEAWAKLSALIREFKPDIIQANAGDTLKYAAFSRFFFGWKAKLIFRNANLISAFVNSFPKRILNQFLLGQVEGVASVSAICAKDFINTFSFPENKVEVLPIGILPMKDVPNLPDDVAKMLNGSDFLIHIGSFVPEKNHCGLFSIFDKILNQFPDLKLLVLGEGTLKSQIQKKFASRSDIVFLGARKDVHAVLPFAKVLLLPSLIEGLPGVILEAMNSNVPVVSYDVGGVSEVLVSDKTGWLVPVGDMEGFAKAIGQALTSDDQRKLEVIGNAKRVIDEHYQIPVLARRFEAFYSKILHSTN